MSTTSKSTLAVARAALAAGTAAYPAHSHANSPRVFTQPQLFACLAVRQFLKADYRRAATTLAEWDGLREAIGLRRPPHWTTLQKADRRLLRLPAVRRLLDATAAVPKRGRGRRRRARVPLAAADSTGLPCGHASRYYVGRRAEARQRQQQQQQQQQQAKAGGRRACRRGAAAVAKASASAARTYRSFGKLEVVIDCGTHLAAAALAGRGPRPDSDRLRPLLDEAAARVSVGTVLADAGYGSEPAHRHARDVLGIRSVMPATLGRPSPNPPAGRYRRVMKRALSGPDAKHYCRYGQRWQVETFFSMLKRLLGDELAARTYWSQVREMLLKVVTVNVMILANAA